MSFSFFVVFIQFDAAFDLESWGCSGFSAWGIHNIDCIVTAMNRHPGVYRAMLAILLDVTVFASQRFVQVGGSTILIHMLKSHLDRKALTAFGAASHTWCDVAPSPSKAQASVETPTTHNSACNRRCGFSSGTRPARCRAVTARRCGNACQRVSYMEGYRSPTRICDYFCLDTAAHGPQRSTVKLT